MNFQRNSSCIQQVFNKYTSMQMDFQDFQDFPGPASHLSHAGVGNPLRDFSPHACMATFIMTKMCDAYFLISSCYFISMWKSCWPLSVKVFFKCPRGNCTLVFFSCLSFDFFAVQGLFSSFFSMFHDLNNKWWVPWKRKLIRKRNCEIVCKQENV